MYAVDNGVFKGGLIFANQTLQKMNKHIVHGTFMSIVVDAYILSATVIVRLWARSAEDVGAKKNP